MLIPQPGQELVLSVFFFFLTGQWHLYLLFHGGFFRLLGADNMSRGQNMKSDDGVEAARSHNLGGKQLKDGWNCDCRHRNFWLRRALSVTWGLYSDNQAVSSRLRALNATSLTVLLISSSDLWFGPSTHCLTAICAYLFLNAQRQSLK